MSDLGDSSAWGKDMHGVTMKHRNPRHSTWWQPWYRVAGRAPVCYGGRDCCSATLTTSEIDSAEVRWHDRGTALAKGVRKSTGWQWPRSCSRCDCRRAIGDVGLRCCRCRCCWGGDFDWAATTTTCRSAAGVASGGGGGEGGDRLLGGTGASRRGKRRG